MTEYPLPNASQDLSGQVALVTGATSGLGWRFARILASAGAKVAIAGRRVERLNELADLIANESGKAHPMPVDMTDANSVIASVQSAEEALGIVTILVNNAGIIATDVLTRTSIDVIDNMLNTNLRGPLILAREVASRLIAAKTSGRMVNISSSAAYHYVGLGGAIYSITKAAVVRLTETLAVEWAKFHINVNAIAPGSFQSEMMDGLMELAGDMFLDTPRRRICDPALLDSTLLYLCSPASEAVTGTIVRVDDAQNPR